MELALKTPTSGSDSRHITKSFIMVISRHHFQLTFKKLTFPYPNFGAFCLQLSCWYIAVTRRRICRLPFLIETYATFFNFCRWKTCSQMYVLANRHIYVCENCLKLKLSWGRMHQNVVIYFPDVITESWSNLHFLANCVLSVLTSYRILSSALQSDTFYCSASSN